MSWYDRLLEILAYEFRLGSARLSLAVVLEFIVLVCLVFLAARITRAIILSRLLSRTQINPGLQRAISRFAGYMVIFVGLLISFQLIEINLSGLAFLAGALGVGLGFGLQTIIGNFVSGLIILIERPVQVGDRIDVGGLQGDVAEINARATKIVTNDNITIIVPNSEFTSTRVINWSHGEMRMRFKIPVRVAFTADARRVEKALLEVAAEVPDVMKDPPPSVRFVSFGESALHFELCVWTETMLQRKGRLTSDVNFRIFDKFRELGIEIPFPQRDLHIKTTPPAGHPLTKTMG